MIYRVWEICCSTSNWRDYICIAAATGSCYFFGSLDFSLHQATQEEEATGKLAIGHYGYVSDTFLE